MRAAATPARVTKLSRKTRNSVSNIYLPKIEGFLPTSEFDFDMLIKKELGFRGCVY